MNRIMIGMLGFVAHGSLCALNIDTEYLSFEYGLAVNVGSYSVVEPAAFETGSATDTAVIPILITNFSSYWRLWTELNHKNFNLGYAQSQIGQWVKTIGVDAILHRSFDVAKHFRPYLGAGLSFAKGQYTHRATTAVDGFVDESYPDRSEFNTSLLFDLGVNFGGPRLGDKRRMIMGFSGSYQLPIDNSVEGLFVRFYTLF